MNIYIIRHSETKYNKLGITQGRKDSPLTQAGKKIAEKLGKKLKNKNIAKIYSSDLGRCIETSKIINKLLKVKIIPSPELREINYGIFNGKPEKDIKKVFEFKNADTAPPGGESFNQVKRRLLSFLKSPNLKKEKGPILIVTHDGCLKAILSYCYKVKFTSQKCSKPENFIGLMEIKTAV